MLGILSFIYTAAWELDIQRVVLCYYLPIHYEYCINYRSVRQLLSIHPFSHRLITQLVSFIGHRIKNSVVVIIDEDIAIRRRGVEASLLKADKLYDGS